jgi:beta-carotene 3-hydroxylase
MYWFINTMIVVATFVGMEFTAWATHKYVMHGFLWALHRDHHEPHDLIFERNDAFFLIF